MVTGDIGIVHQPHAAVQVKLRLIRIFDAKGLFSSLIEMLHAFPSSAALRAFDRDHDPAPVTIVKAVLHLRCPRKR